MDIYDTLTFKQIYSENRTLIYEGYTLFDKPYGAGTAFWENGRKYQEGIFNIKGLQLGKEYFSSGRLRFDGLYRICTGYGPNYPIYGKFFDNTGSLVFSGRPELRFGRVGCPTVVSPQSFGSVVQENSPKLHPFLWDDAAKSKAAAMNVHYKDDLPVPSEKKYNFIFDDKRQRIDYEIIPLPYIGDEHLEKFLWKWIVKKYDFLSSWHEGGGYPCKLVKIKFTYHGNHYIILPSSIEIDDDPWSQGFMEHIQPEICSDLEKIGATNIYKSGFID